MHQRNRQRNTKRKGTQSNKRKDLIIDHRRNPIPFEYAKGDKAIRMSLTFFAQITSDEVGQVSHRVSLRNIERAYDGTGTYEDAVNLSNVFDTYKPEYLTFETVPIFAINTFSAGSLIFACDKDDNDLSQSVNTYAAAASYANKYMIDPREKNCFTFRIPKLSAGSIPGTLTTIPAVINNGFLDFAAPPYEGVVYIVGGGYPANLTICDLVLTMHLLVKYKR